MAVPAVTAEILRETLDYDPATGILTWRRSGGGVAAGDAAQHVNPQGYVRVNIGGRIYQGHRLAWLHTYGVWPTGDLDHRDGCRTNNRIANLREATRSQNNANAKRNRNNSSGYKGVSLFKPTGRYMAYINAGGTRKYLGYFATAGDAHAAYCKAAADIFGNFARVA